MKTLYSRILPLSAAGLFVLSGLSPIQAQQISISEAPITVVGSEEVQVKPDLAVVSLGVVTTSKQAKAAVVENNKAMAELIKDLEKLAVAEKDMQTNGFEVTPETVDVDRAGRAITPRITGYTVSNSLTVRLRDPARLGELLDIAVTNGVNQIGQVQFTSSNPKEAIDKARAGAVKDAVNKARIMADAAGVKLGRIIYMNDNGSRVDGGSERQFADKAAAGSSMVPTASGELTYSVNVSLSFAIDQ